MFLVDMARKPVFKTPLGRRLADVRENYEMDRDQFALLLDGVSASALANYERGDNVPDALALTAYRNRFGVNITWLITGEGEMFEDRSKAPAPRLQVDPQLLRKLHRAARLAYIDEGHYPPDEDSLAVEAGSLYNALLEKVSDIRDTRLVEAVIPLLIDDLKIRLAEATANPGSGKLSAS